MANAVLQLEQVTHRYGAGARAVEVLRELSLEVRAGELVSLMGPSGSGKTTLLQMAGLLDRPTAGAVRIDGAPTSQLSEEQRTRLRRAKIGFVFQFHHLLPEFSALENAHMPLHIAGTPDVARAAMLLEKLGLNDRLHHRPGALSGGERQRVAIARALVHQPKLVLADEPTGNLDEHLAEEVFAQFVALAHESGAGVLVATHNPQLARLADRSLRLHYGQIEGVAA